MLMKLNLLAARILCALLAAFISLSASAYDFEVDGIYYNITSTTDKTVAVTYKNNGNAGNYNDADTYSGTVTVPSIIAYNGTSYSVTGINYNAFDGCTALIEVILPSTITSIGSSAFYECKNLKAVNIPEGIQTIGYLAFGCCSSLEQIVLPETVTSIAFSAFNGCSKLTKANIPEGVTKIEDSTFRNCSSLQSITIPSIVKAIGTYVFQFCNALEDVNIVGDNLETIGEDAFRSCKFATFRIPSSVTTIGEGAITECRNLTEVNIPDGVTAIEPWTFSNCSSLKYIVLSDNIESIGEYAFSSCSSMETATVGSGVKSIDAAAFYGTKSLKLMTVSAIEPPTACEIIDNQLFSGTFLTWHYENTDLRVPAESIEKYRTAPVWENFFKDRNPLTVIEGVEAAEGAESEVVARYDLSGRPVADDYRGMTIVRRADGSAAKEILR